MRGTVYIVENGVPRTRRILTIDIDQIVGWQERARGILTGQGFINCDFEFGPITERWNKL